MKFRPILLAWLLLLGATLAMGGGAWWLLDREADRIEAVSAGVLANSTASLAESLDLLMEEIRTGVSVGLLQARNSGDPQTSLAELTANNPYVKAGFSYRATDGVTVWFGERDQEPSPSALKQTTGHYPWQMNQLEIQEEAPAAADLGKIFEYDQAANSATQSLPAPTDIFEANIAPVEAQTQAYQDSGPRELRSPAQSKSEALKQQRATVRKVIILSNVAQEEAPALADVSGIAPAESLAVSSLAKDSANEDQEDVSPRPRELGDYGMIILPEKAAPAVVLEAEAQESIVNGGQIGFLHAPSAAPFAGRQRYLPTEGKRSANPERQGWVMHDIDGVENFMAWSNLPDTDGMIGAWLDREAILAELAKTINISQVPDVQFKLLGPDGVPVLGSANRPLHNTIEAEPMLSLLVGSSLPGWRLQAYPSLGQNPFGLGFRLLGGLVVAGLSLAILLGGSLLLWQAQRDALDAQRKTTFVANVSHELKTPLTSIRLFAEMLHDGRAGDEAKQRRYLQTMLNETQRLTRLVNNVLDFSRLERGRRDFQAEMVDLDAVVAEIMETQRERLLGDGLDVVYHKSTDPIRAMADRDAIEQILLNLLDNAAKYASTGKRAEVRLTADNRSWTLRVCDFGPGIPPRERQLVFEAFHRMDDRLTADRPGCGLGLSIAARLAQGMGGQLSLTDNQPQGCCFQLTAPLNPNLSHE